MVHSTLKGAVPLEKMLCTHNLSEVTLLVSGVLSFCRLQVGVVRFSRSCCNVVYWPFFDLFKTLRLTCFQGMPSKWFHSGIARWRQMIGRLLPGEHIILSKHANVLNRKTMLLLLLLLSEHLFHQQSMTTAVFAVLLPLLAFCPPQAGGLRGVASGRAALELLRGVSVLLQLA